MATCQQLEYVEGGGQGVISRLSGKGTTISVSGDHGGPQKISQVTVEVRFDIQPLDLLVKVAAEITFLWLRELLKLRHHCAILTAIAGAVLGRDMDFMGRL